ncbi:PHP domain-containing protein [Chengkuizengella axinellae]|uniref:PHP domain-containing protein n=1 Tax=Chengkuizengella axinellae TaxID=3064388 RepID=A0ABT9IVI4_9BACL|nr:PHP domain-containing protein [Chengkuizengella sp. 2205SS18-9]MDP5273352.1 PHP domain-containing protein [Chengkuizengella sp. 2205SS18-9]
MSNHHQFIDLHTHTLASDGLHMPSDNVKMAKEKGLAGIAITDHDTVAGVKQAIEEGQKIGIEVVPGIEISTVANKLDIHILGYYIDYEDQVFLERLNQLRDVRSIRNDMMIKKLQELGIEITIEDVLALAPKKKTKQTVGRPHIAEVLVHKGIVKTIKEAFDVYIGKDGKAFVSPPRIHPTTAIDWIRQAGGSAVIAHPGLYENDELVEELIQHGVDGLEVYHSDHSPDEEKKYLKLANKYQLTITAGSDFHGERNGEVFHAPIGGRKVNIDVLSELKRK